jgi:hypothetical protein
MALADFMRLSSMKAAHADVGYGSVQEIRAANAYLGQASRAKPLLDLADGATGADGTFRRSPRQKAIERW